MRIKACHFGACGSPVTPQDFTVPPGFMPKVLKPNFGCSPRHATPQGLITSIVTGDDGSSPSSCRGRFRPCAEPENRTVTLRVTSRLNHSDCRRTNATSRWTFTVSNAGKLVAATDYAGSNIDGGIFDGSRVDPESESVGANTHV